MKGTQPKRVLLRRSKDGGGGGSSSTSSRASAPRHRPDDASLARVCVIGRPNVGKSTLFNRLVGRRDVLVYDTPGSHVTRDYQERRASLGDLSFRLVDTSGMEPFAEAGSVQDRLLLQTERVVLHSDAVLFLLDARSGLMPGDKDLAKWLRSVFPVDRVLTLANKSELGGLAQLQRAQAIWADGAALGLGEPINISALTGDGLSDVYAALRPLVDDVARARRAGTYRPPALPAQGSIHSDTVDSRTGEAAAPSDFVPADLTAQENIAVTEGDLGLEALADRPWSEKEVQSLERRVAGARDEGEGEGTSLQDLRKLLRYETKIHSGQGKGDFSDDFRRIINSIFKKMHTVHVLKYSLCFYVICLLTLSHRSPTLPPLRVSFVGLPNVGKSTLMNAFLGRERVLVGPEAGLTRDVILEPVEWDGAPVLLQDTPGAIKPRSHAAFDSEGGAVTQLSQQARARAMGRSDLVVMVADASRMTRDRRMIEERLLSGAELDLCAEILAEGRALVIAANKLDAVPPGQAEELMRSLAKQIAGCGRGLQGTPLVGISAAEREGLGVMMRAVWDAYLKWNKQVSSARLNRWLGKAKTAAVGSGGANMMHRVRFLVQMKARPPTFMAFCNGPLPARDEQIKGLANAISHDFNFEGSPIRILCRYSEAQARKDRLQSLHRALTRVAKPLDGAELADLSPNERRVQQRRHAIESEQLRDKIGRIQASRAGKTKGKEGRRDSRERADRFPSGPRRGGGRGGDRSISAFKDGGVAAAAASARDGGSNSFRRGPPSGRGSGDRRPREWTGADGGGRASDSVSGSRNSTPAGQKSRARVGSEAELQRNAPRPVGKW